MQRFKFPSLFNMADRQWKVLGTLSMLDVSMLYSSMLSRGILNQPHNDSTLVIRQEEILKTLSDKIRHIMRHSNYRHNGI